MEPTSPQTQDSGIGAIVGSVIVVLVIIAGAFYLLETVRERRQAVQSPTQEETSNVDATAELEAELQSIDTENIDAELAEIEAAF